MTEMHGEGAAAPSRRAVLLAGAAGGAGVALLAACSPGSGRSGSSPSSAHPADRALTTLAAIHIGAAVSVTLPDGQPAVVSRPTPSSVACFSAVCTHMGCTVLPAGNRLECPCHGSVFNALTGQVLQGPAGVPLARIAVKVADGKVLTAGSA